MSLAGMLINRVGLTDKKRMQFAREYLKHVDSWGLIDGFAEKMKNFDQAHRKALTKMLESFRFTEKRKKEIRALRSAIGK